MQQCRECTTAASSSDIFRVETHDATYEICCYPWHSPKLLYLVFLVYYVLTYITVEYALHDSSNGSSGAVTCHTRLLIILYSPQDRMTHEIKGTKRCTILSGQFTT